LDNEGRRSGGIFHMMKDHEADQFLSDLLSKLEEWGKQCQTNEVSCGKLLKIARTGRGGFQVNEMVVGPFRS